MVKKISVPLGPMLNTILKSMPLAELPRKMMSKNVSSDYIDVEERELLFLMIFLALFAVFWAFMQIYVLKLIFTYVIKFTDRHGNLHPWRKGILVWLVLFFLSLGVW
tara:strand:+ start:2079 stop:2399 length:321 start_codon:yes stop_codon:yes gene_type:complete